MNYCPIKPSLKITLQASNRKKWKTLKRAYYKLTDSHFVIITTKTIRIDQQNPKRLKGKIACVGSVDLCSNFIMPIYRDDGLYE